MGLKEILEKMVSENFLTIDEANAEKIIIEKNIVKNYVELQYVPGSRNAIELNSSKEILEKLFYRIKSQWVKLGDDEPYVSVLSDEKFKRENIKNNLAEFQNSGKIEVSQLDNLCAKNNLNINYGNCLEFGCGVGRMSAHLAPKFKKVVGYDISPGNISIAKNYLMDLNIKNVELSLINSLEDLKFGEKADVFISMMVLQHNPPPLQKYFLEKILANLNPGGIFYFQTVTHAPSYGYTAEANFNYPPNTQSEMHCLPISEVFKIIQKNNLLVVDVIKDGGGYNHDSNSFLGIRPA
jgi:2-polyprenyl-3-methyl-5-hydroxy-6-metoxy-1,4-benzoquinol methylase